MTTDFTGTRTTPVRLHVASFVAGEAATLTTTTPILIREIRIRGTKAARDFEVLEIQVHLIVKAVNIKITLTGETEQLKREITICIKKAGLRTTTPTAGGG